jgi:flagellar biosynthesis/type III secretory pathway chaperone
MVLAQLNELKDVIRQTIETFDKLITVIDLEKESIIAFDPNSTLQFTHQKENLCLKQSQLFKVQRELMKSISRIEGLSNDSDLKAIAKKIADSELESLAAQLLESATITREKNQLSKKFVEHSLHYVDSTVQMLRGKTSRRQRTYNSFGRYSNAQTASGR